MNNIWGDMSQYNPVTWHWLIAVYLFLAGLSAGSVLVAIGLRWLRGDQEESPVLQAAALVAPVAISLGMLCLVFDLTRPLHFWVILLHYNLSSVMSIGVLALLLFIPLVFVYSLLVLRQALSNFGLAWLQAPLARLLPLRKALEVCLFTLALVVGAYTGFLISAMNIYPMLNSAILPALFLVSGISAGAAANTLVALWLLQNSPAKRHGTSLDMQRLHGLEIPLLLVEVLCLFMLFCALYFKGGAAALALGSLHTGPWAWVFWLLVVAVGFAIPLLTRMAAWHGRQVMVLAACCTLTGVLALRHFILYAGQSYLG